MVFKSDNFLWKIVNLIMVINVYGMTATCPYLNRSANTFCRDVNAFMTVSTCRQGHGFGTRSMDFVAYFLKKF